MKMEKKRRVIDKSSGLMFLTAVLLLIDIEIFRISIFDFISNETMQELTILVMSIFGISLKLMNFRSSNNEIVEANSSS